MAGEPLEMVVLVGLQGSGKSSLYRERFADTHVHISKDLFPNNRDKPRRQRELIEQAFSEGRSVVVDNTNARREDRAELIRLARDHGARVVCYFLDVPVQECLRRNAGRTGKAKVPVVAIFATRKKLEPPTEEEGFDAIFRITAPP